MHEIKQFNHSVYSFTLNRLEWVKKDHHYRLRFTWCNHYLLLYIAKGEGFIYINEEKIAVNQEEVYFCKPGDTYALHLTAGIELYAFHFEVAGEPWQRMNTIVRLQAVDPVWSYCNQLHSLSEPDNQLENFRMQIVFQELFYFILSSESGASENRLLEAKKYMDLYYDKTIQIEHLARIAQVSEHYFVDLFTKQYGVSPIQYLHQQRLAEAKRLLIQSDARSRDIAKKIGISDEYYFSRWFKKKAGMSPSAFRSTHKTYIAVSHRDYMGQILALDIIPYAAPLHPKWTPFYYEHYRTEIPVHLSAYKIDQHHQANMEKMKQYRPEIIITNQSDSSQLDHKRHGKSKILRLEEETTWRMQLQEIAAFLKKEDRAAKWLRSFDRKKNNLKMELQSNYSDSFFLFLRKFKQSFYLTSSRSVSELFFEELGMRSAYGQQPVHEQEIQLEEIVEMNPDHIILMICQEQETLYDWKQLQHSMDWMKIKAVNEENVHCIATDPWFEYSAVAHDRMLQIIRDLLIEFCPNDDQ
ncbi:AraC family transcriptional regulator [Gracilibacillus salinarum]|uniref:ABC transporter substrate-binding protein n=1 Tax=Gracilibacillus salinarum TaxID=2932255 RepID=A0ABY4GGD6_9BACI|nr:ABC transporter substrate-binding protein [Gracilibacillus salinarum]UOQ83381.1 ABC transporter substrate-binding protein [Gracilibacillus salinarum]